MFTVFSILSCSTPATSGSIFVVWNSPNRLGRSFKWLSASSCLAVVLDSGVRSNKIYSLVSSADLSLTSLLCSDVYYLYACRLSVSAILFPSTARSIRRIYITIAESRFPTYGGIGLAVGAMWPWGWRLRTKRKGGRFIAWSTCVLCTIVRAAKQLSQSFWCFVT